MTSYSTQSLQGRGYGDHQTFTERIHNVLTERECSIFDKGVAVYHKRRDVTGFVESLSMVLNTNQKRQMLVQIRNNYVKPSDTVKFNNLCIKFGIALPARGTLPSKQKKRMSAHDEFSGPKLILVKRNQDGEWGFSVRGGIEVGMGIFVSWVDRDSFAEKAGLRIGDYIHRIDDTNFDGFSQVEAVQYLRNKSRVTLLVTSYGKIPGFQSANKFYRWVDRNGKPVPPPPEEGQLAMDVLEKQVTMTVESGMELGVSIRGGAEHGLGIYVSAVDPASLADLHGIQPGNQLLEVNGVIFYNILHADAAKALRSQRTMVMKVKDVGSIPTSRIPLQRPVPPEGLQSSQAPSQLSLSSRAKKKRATEVAYHQSSADEGKSPVLLKQSLSPAKNEMNDFARSILSKSEMAAFTYYISQYEHEQIEVDVLVNKLLKLFNTKEKMQLISEVRNIIRLRDIDEFNELTIHKEIKSRKGGHHNTTGSISSLSDDEESSYPVKLRHKHMLNGDDDFGDLDEIPTRLSPSIGRMKTSTPDQQGLLARKMRERRHKMHESVVTTVEGWDEAELVPKMSKQEEEAIYQTRLKEVEEKLKKEFEEEKQKLEQDFQAEKQKIMKEEVEYARKATEEEVRKQMEESTKRELMEIVRKEEMQKLEKEFAEKLQSSVQEEKMKAREEREKREKLEQEMRGSFKNEIESKIRLQTKQELEKQFDDKIEKTVTAERQRTDAEIKRRQDLEKEVKSTWENQLQQQKEMNEKLEKTIQEERKRSDEERKRREQLEKELMNKTAMSFEEKDKLRAQLEEKLRKESEERIKREREERQAMEAREKARLEEEMNNNKSLRDQLEDERRKREAIEREKRELQEQKENIEKEKEKIQEQLAKRNSMRRDQVKNRTAVESEDIDSHVRDEELRKIAEEERKLKMLEYEEEAMRMKEEIAEQRRQEIEEEQERLEELQKRRKEEEKMERRRRKEEKERKRKAEEERLKQVRAEEERKQREEEERVQVEEELRKIEEEKRKREEQERLELEKKKAAAKEATFSFEPSAMDDLVSEMAKISPMPSPREGHVSFQDQQQRQKGIIEQERRRAEQMLANKLAQHRVQEEGVEEEGISYGGYTGLKGKIIKVNVTKVNRKLGIAVDGGANTNQKAIIIRQIVAEGSAAQTGAGMAVGQQILTINGKSLKGLKHKDAVLAIKSGFDGPLNKTIEFVLLAHEDDE